MTAPPFDPHATSAEALAAAIESDDGPEVHRLLEAGVSPNAMSPQRELPVLTIAAERGHAAIVDDLIRHGAEPRGAPGNRPEYSPLDAAIAGGNVHCIEVLLASGLGADQWEIRFGVFSAVRTRQCQLVQMFLSRGGDPANWGPHESPLIEATETFEFEARYQQRLNAGMLELLLGAMRNPDERRTEIRRALRTCIYDHRNLAVRFLLDQAPGVYDEPDDDYCECPIEAAAAASNGEAAELLLSRGPCTLEGAPKPAGYFSSRTPLMAAAFAEDSAMARLLLDAGADPEGLGRRGGDTPLIATCGREHSSCRTAETALLLLERGARVDAQSRSGATALMLAVSAGREELVEVLLNHGANLRLKDRKGRDVFDLARARGDGRIEALLAARQA